jgi:hypothetical protein
MISPNERALAANEGVCKKKQGEIIPPAKNKRIMLKIARLWRNYNGHLLVQSSY